MLYLAIILSSSCFFSFWLTGLVRSWALKTLLLDIPNQRSSHDTPTPRGGGLAILLVFLMHMFLLYLAGSFESNLFWLFFGALLMVGSIGLWDDFRHVPAIWRLLVHFLAASLVIGGLFATSGPDELASVSIFLYPLAMFYLVWMLNLFNFMDGIDGLAASESVFIALAGSLMIIVFADQITFALMPLCLAGASFGFLLWNWSPAKIFMGDVGSGFLGFSLGVFAISSSIYIESISIWTWLVLSGIFMVDSTLTLTRRILTGQRWYQAHRSHAYQHAALHYGSHLPVTAAVIIINLLWLLPMAILCQLYPLRGGIFTLIAYVPLVILSLHFDAGRKEN